MRKKIVAGNWKMNTLLEEGVNLISQIVNKSADIPADVVVIVAPPFTHLQPVGDKIKGSSICLSAQNCANKKNGAYTGEVSVAMLKSFGCSHVIIGHSERREYYGETNAILVDKIRLALEEGIVPIYCVGETLTERESEKHFEVIQKQLEEVVLTLSDADLSKIIIAYEPVWAIGTGRVATSAQAQEIHHFIRQLLVKKSAQAVNIPILYGGSCNPGNAKEIFSQSDVDGGLIGGASLKAEDFIKLTQSFS